ncbi:hypothetical protein AAVH_27681 [Aphelenchoides avenae]|nr:hypothetical protein AAVH_27681 [Aphelenchus avenae]
MIYAQSADTVPDAQACLDASYKANSTVVAVPKISEAREYGFLYWFWPEKAVYVGATLQSGMMYQWYDGAVATALPWASGRPVGGSNALVLVKSDYTVTDTTAANMTILTCKKPATYSAYDASAKFL